MKAVICAEHEKAQGVMIDLKNHTLKQVIEWGNEICPQATVLTKRECQQCWAEILKEVEGG